jgi:2-keto-4-pentenoate hydratase
VNKPGSGEAVPAGGSAEDEAVRLLGEAARTGVRLAALPGEPPLTAAAALAVQDRIVAASGKRVAGWKVATADGVPTYGAIFEEDCYASGSVLPAARYPLRGIEGEVAFRLLRDLPAGSALSREELVPLLAAFPAFEIVDTRFASYADTPAIDRLADRMANGGMVIGEATGAPADLSRLPVRLTRNGQVVVDRVGGHPRGDPLLPVLEFVNATRRTRTLPAGQFITAGSFTGLEFGSAGEAWEVSFAGLGAVRLRLE